MGITSPNKVQHTDPFADDPKVSASVLDVAGVFVVVLDPTGRITYFNVTCEHATGYTAKEMVGTYVWDKLIVPEQRQAVENVFHDLVRQPGVQEHENYWLTNSGKLICIHWSNTSILGTGGEVRWVIGTGLDITEKKRVQNQLEEQAAKLRAVVETAVDGIITIDERGIIESVNPAAERLFAYPADELIGMNISTLMPAPYREEHDRYISDYLDSGDAKIIGIGREVRGLSRDGRIFPINLVVSEVSLPGKRLFTGIVRDISDRQLIEKRERQRLAEHAHAARLAALGEMASGIAHELNQPLAAIVSFADACRNLIDKEEIPRDIMRDALAQISEQGVRAGDIIRRLRQFVRTGTLDREVVNLNALINDVLAMVAHEIHLNEVDVKLRLKEYLSSVWADKLQIEQVLLNLVRNAIEAMEDSPKHGLLIESTEDDNQMLVRIQDSGCGLETAPENLFKAFYTTKEKGTGLGLSISYSIIEAHGGTLSANSNDDGGATFWFSLPAADDIE